MLALGLVAIYLLAERPFGRKANETASIDARGQTPRRQGPSAASAVVPPAEPTASNSPPPRLPADEAKPVDKSAAARDEAASEPATSAVEADEPLGIVAESPKARRPEERQGIAANEPEGLSADAPHKPAPDPFGLPQGPKRRIIADTSQGLYEERTKPKTAEWLGERGGTIESQRAVEAGLDWLARHQGEHGHWGPDCLGAAPNSRCDQNAPCLGSGQAYEVSQTGLALLAFQAAGHYYFNDQKYSEHVQNGLDFLVEDQAPDGSIVGSQNPSPQDIAGGSDFDHCFMYEHAMGTFALCEACAVAIAEGKKPEAKYQIAAINAVEFIERVQHDDGGWRYTVNPGDESDCSISGWVMLALKTAREAKVHVSEETVERMLEFFAAHYAEDGRTHYQLGGGGTDAMTGVGMMAVEFFKHKLDSPIVRGGAEYLTQQAFEAGQVTNYYVWYNCTLAMFQVGGEPWERWNGAVRDRVIGLQVRGEGCERGSWPPNDQYGGQGGRIYSTALAVLTLEVYYRFGRISDQLERGKILPKAGP